MIECMMIDLLMHKSMMFTSESGKGVLLPFVWAEYLDATTATPPRLSRQQPTHALTDRYTNTETLLLVTDCGAAGARGQRGPGHGERPEAAPRPPRRGPPLLLPAGAGRGAPARAGGPQQAAEGAAGGRRLQHRAAHLLAPGAAQGALHPLPLPAPRPGLPAHAASIPGDLHQAHSAAEPGLVIPFSVISGLSNHCWSDITKVYHPLSMNYL